MGAFVALLFAGCGGDGAAAAGASAAGLDVPERAIADRGARLVGFDGEDVIAVDEERVLALRPGRSPRVRARAPGLVDVAAADGALALTSDNFEDDLSGPYLSDFVAGENQAPTNDDGPTRQATDRTVVSARVAPYGQRELARCTGQQANRLQDVPAAAGDHVVVTVDCGGRGVVLLDGPERTRRDGGGDVLALAAAGRRVGWIARTAADAPATLHLLDLAGGTERTVRLGPVAGPGRGEARLVLAADGRAQAELLRPGPNPDPAVVDTRCHGVRIVSDGADPTGARCRQAMQFTDEGYLASRAVAGPDRGQFGALVERFDPDGRRLGLLQRRNSSLLGNAVASGGRAALTRATCRRTQIVLGGLRGFQPPRAATCPVKVTVARRVGAREVRLTVRCPQGCRVGRRGAILQPELRTGVPVASAFLLNAVDLAAGRTATLRFRFSAGTRLERVRRVILSGVAEDGTIFAGLPRLPRRPGAK